MAVNETLTKRVRAVLSNLDNVQERKIFRGIAFMLNDKMCVTVADDRIMCRIDPSTHEELIRKPGVSTMKMRGRDYIGWILVKESTIPNKKELTYWVDLALAYNEKIK